MKVYLTTIFLVFFHVIFGQTEKQIIESSNIDTICMRCLDTAIYKTSDMMQCFAVARDSWDKEITKSYNILLKHLDKDQKEKLIIAQTAWKNYTDKEFELSNSIYYDPKQGKEKRIDAVARQAEILKQRAIELRSYSDLFTTW